MKFVAALLACGLLAAGHANANPVVIEDSAVITRPDSSWQYFGRFGVAVDGDYALVSGERYVADPAAEGGQRHEGAAFIYRRASATSWTYVGRLGPIAPITRLQPGLAMEGGVAMVITDRYRIWQRSGETWVLQPVAGIAPDSLTGSDIEIDNGRILARCSGCADNFVVMRKVNGTWLPEGEWAGTSTATPDMPHSSLDIQGNVLLRGDESFGGFDPDIRMFRRGANGWEFAFDILEDSVADRPLAVTGNYIAYSQERRFGTTVRYDYGLGDGAVSRFRPADLAMQINDARGATAIEHVGGWFAQRNYRYDTQGYAWHLFGDNGDAGHPMSEVATLQPRTGAWLGNRLDDTAGRVIINGWDDNGGDNSVRVFELPANFAAPDTRVYDFEPPTSASDWQPTAGSAFSVVKVGYTYVYRQGSTAGTPGSFLQTAMTNQAIETDVTLRAISGTDRWIGLATRRTDDTNYYYVAFRTSGVIELKRMQGGAITTLATAAAPLVAGRTYKLRLESIGTLHRVVLDGRVVLSARDATFGSGVAGILMNRAAADWDNVTVTPNPFAVIFADDFSAPQNDRWSQNFGTRQTGGYLTLQKLTGRHDAVAGVNTEDEVVRARIRPVSFADPADWVGLAARWLDYRNHIYVSLHGRGVIALWKRVGGNITQLATQRLTVTPGTWYDVRLETAANNTRVYVDGVQVLSSTADLGPIPAEISVGGVALQTQNASADFDDLIAYRP